TYPVEVHLQLSKIGEKNVIVSIILDITERKEYTTRLENTVKERTEQLEDALNKEKELNELKTKFLTMVSHEFKTPLSGILTSAYLIKKYNTTEEQAKRKKHIKVISQKVDYLTMILDDFLSLENLESGTYHYKMNNFHISRVINEVVYNANMILKEGQQIIYPNNIDDLVMHQDEKILELILSNILNNAIKYSKQNSKIKLSVKQQNSETVFSIEDYGLGIPEQDIDKIFTRYFRAENVLHIQGTGIGLNLVRSHVENMGGSISIKSKENSLTTVTVILPTTIDHE
ncbi:MAG: GHKL domain-containing protein, partial [Winogradskyella sp.]|nr:GHKL domain-containing protein [Winogradskyella sp.]